MRLLLRPLLSFVVLTALVIALLQGVGRIAFGLLAHLEVTANQLLAPRHIRVAGLRGDWHGFNPSVRLSRVELPAGQLEDVYVELDLLKTLFEGRAVLYRARVGDGSLRVEKPDGQPWQLAGMPPSGGSFDPMPILTGTDQLQFSGALAFARGQGPATVLDVDYIASNRDDVGRHRLILRNGAEECAAPCELRLAFERRDAPWSIGAPEIALTLSATRFLLGEPLLGVASAQLDAVEVDWRETDAGSRGRAIAVASGALAADSLPFSVRIDGVARGNDGRRWGQLTRLELSHGAQRLALPSLGIEFEDGVIGASLAELPVPELIGLLESALARNAVASRWLAALALDGRVANVHAFYRLQTGELGYGFDLADFRMDGYHGIPSISGGAGAVVGRTRLATGRPQAEVGNVVRVKFDASDVQIAIPDQLHGEWRVPYARGLLQAYFRRDDLGFRGLDLATRIGDSEVRGSIAVSRRGQDERDRRISALARVDRITVDEARRFVPYTLQPRLYAWLTETPMAGVMQDGRVAVQGQFRVPPGEPGRRLEIAGDVTDGSVRFLPDWPAVQDFAGRLEVAGSEVRVSAERAQSLGANLAGTRLRLRDNGAFAELSLQASLDAGAGLALIRESPLQRWLAFVAPDWAASGPLRLSGEIGIPRLDAIAQPEREPYPPGLPVSAVEPPQGLMVDLGIELDGVDLNLPAYRLRFDDLRGPLHYGYPASLRADGITGTMFDAPVRLTAGSEDGRFRVTGVGTVRAADLPQLLDVESVPVAAGAAAFEAAFDVAAPPGPEGRGATVAAPRISIVSDLVGMTLRLPGRYAKELEESVPATLQMVLPDGERRLSFEYRDASGWLRFGDRLEQGAIGLGREPPTLTDGVRQLVVSGELDRLNFDDLTVAAGANGILAVPVRFRELTIDELVIGSLVVADGRVEADLDDGGFDVRLVSEALAGRASRGRGVAAADDSAPADSQAAPIDLWVERLHLPRGKGGRDPLSTDIIRRIPPMNVVIDEMRVGDADYGRWAFRLRQQDEDLWFYDLKGRLREVDVTGKEGGGLVWRGALNETAFDGQLRMKNLADVLPLWGYAPNIETASASMVTSLNWPGSPASFDLLTLLGEVQVQAKSGRFLEVDSGGGAQRILSLLNFTTIAKRMSLDFSDVIGKGISFDKLKATFSLDRGMLNLVKPLDVEGTGLKFRLSGKVNLADRSLDHEMIVTLPVTRSLPWYAAYVALANPIVGLGVLVGERVLRKPLEQFSSAKYKITGTVENPEVKLVSVFDTTSSAQPVELPVQEGELPLPVAPAEGSAAPVPAPAEQAEEQQIHDE